MFIIKDNKLTTTTSFEESTVQLCQQYDNLVVVVVLNGPAWRAVVNFMVNLPFDIRSTLPASKGKWEVAFENGSTIRFLSMNEGHRSMVPDPPVHVLITYSKINQNTLHALYNAMVEYDGPAKRGQKGIFPLVYDDGYVFWGEDFAYEAEYMKERMGKITEMTFSVPKETDVSKYPKAKELLEEEEKALKSFENELKESQSKYKN